MILWNSNQRPDDESATLLIPDSHRSSRHNSRRETGETNPESTVEQTTPAPTTPTIHRDDELLTLSKDAVSTAFSGKNSFGNCTINEDDACISNITIETDCTANTVQSEAVNDQLVASSSSSSGPSGDNSKHLTTHSSSGLLNFFGLKFNKSSTRHLDRTSSQGDSVDKSSESACNPNRYTKFPLRGSVGIPNNSEGNKSNQLSSETSSTCSSDPQSESSCQSSNSTVPQSNSRFDISQIQATNQTKVYSNPNRNRSPSRGSRKGTFSPSNFLSKSICSFGKKSGNSSNHKSSSSSFINRLKSKSDNNLHRVDLHSVTVSTIRSTGTARSITTSSQNIYNLEPRNDLRLNSVQIGDHATIHLPWTGSQRNNLSSTTSNRVHQNTHNNNLSVRYVECGFQVSTNDSSNTSLRRELSNARRQPKTEYARCTVSKRRSKSLERDSSCRISRNSTPTSSYGTLNSSQSSSEASEKYNKKQNSISSKVKVKEVSPLPRTNRCLTPEEQEVLLRNISWDNTIVEATLLPPPRPEKPASLTSKFSCSGLVTVSQITKPERKPLPKRPPHIGVIQRSAPNSFSNSSESESGDTFHYCTPPSPPPRPPSSLKPESRLIIQHPPKRNSEVVRSNSFASTTSSVRSLGELESNSKLSENSSIHLQRDRSSNSSSPFHKITQENSEDASNSLNCPSSRSSSRLTLCQSPSSETSQQPQIKMSIEEARNSGFINKPSKGWLHSDQLLSREGVTYTVRYIGCLDVNTSMKSLDFDTRSLIAKECINQVCEAAGLKSVERKRKIDRHVTRILGLRPRLDHAGSDVHLTITSTCLKLTSLDSGAVIASHEMPNISFASGGDATMLDFIAYVAKDAVVGRACFILECGSGLAQDVIITIGQAFELRFKEYIQKRPPPPRLPSDDPEYYNDLPGKLPPDVSKEDGKSNSNHEFKSPLGKMKDIPTLTLPITSDAPVNLIDFEAPTPPAFGPTTQDRQLESLLLGPDPVTPTFLTVAGSSSNSVMGTGLGLPNSPSQPQPPGNKDPFDMQPFATDLQKPLTSDEERQQLATQTWFHGSISRTQAEKLVQNDGDFLVRESQTTPGQYVLTGLQNGSPKHLLLVDPEGVVRTKDQTFDNVIHLIRHHSENSLPIISAESMVILRYPVSTGPQ